MHRPFHPTLFLLLSFFIFLVPKNGCGKEKIIDDFADGLDPGWEVRAFAGLTEYAPMMQDNRAFLQAVSHGKASGLFYKIDYDPVEFPIMTWSWKVDHVLAKGDALTKEGDDYAARIYVVFPSMLFWKTRAINYVWSNKLPKETAVPNAHTGNAMMIAVQCGPDQTGKWITEQRNIYEDFKRLFGTEPPDVGAIAIMTDTDNTGGQASACYGPIRIRSGSEK